MVSKIFYFQPYLGKIFILTSIFQMGWVQPPTSHYMIVKVPYIGPDWPWRKTTAFQVSPGPVKWMCFPNRKTPIGIAIDLYLRRCASESEESDDILILMIGNDWKWKHYSFFWKAKYIDDSKDIMVQFRPLLEEVFFCGIVWCDVALKLSSISSSFMGGVFFTFLGVFI